MERMNSEIRLDVLRRANSDLEHFFSHFSGVPVSGTHEEVEALMQVERALRSVGALLDRGLEEGANRETQEELASYRGNLLRLQRELAVMQNSAANCRSQLFTRQRHLRDAQAWWAASRTTQ